jgi:hypothetical protein
MVHCRDCKHWEPDAAQQSVGVCGRLRVAQLHQGDPVPSDHLAIVEVEGSDGWLATRETFGCALGEVHQ